MLDYYKHVSRCDRLLPGVSSSFRTLTDDVSAHARQDSRQRRLEVMRVAEEY